MALMKFHTVALIDFRISYKLPDSQCENGNVTILDNSIANEKKIIISSKGGLKEISTPGFTLNCSEGYCRALPVTSP